MSDLISGLDARMILDSRGMPTLEVDCYVSGVLMGRTAVPSGASTGAYEAVELRDGDTSKWLGKGVDQAILNVVENIQEAIVGMPVDAQREIDEILIELDGTPNKAKLPGTFRIIVHCHPAYKLKTVNFLQLFLILCKHSL